MSWYPRLISTPATDTHAMPTTDSGRAHLTPSLNLLSNTGRGSSKVTHKKQFLQTLDPSPSLTPDFQTPVLPFTDSQSELSRTHKRSNVNNSTNALKKHSLPTKTSKQFLSGPLDGPSRLFLPGLTNQRPRSNATGVQSLSRTFRLRPAPARDAFAGSLQTKLSPFNFPSASASGSASTLKPTRSALSSHPGAPRNGFSGSFQSHHPPLDVSSATTLKPVSSSRPSAPSEFLPGTMQKHSLSFRVPSASASKQTSSSRLARPSGLAFPGSFAMSTSRTP